MKISNFLPILALFFAFSCSTSEESATVNPGPITPAIVPLNVTAAQASAQDAEAPQSRAILDNAVTKWENGDQIVLFAASYEGKQVTAPQLTATNVTADSKRALFEGDGPEPAATDSYYAAYPADCQINSTAATFTIGSAQTATTTPQLMMAAKIADTSKDAVMLNFEPVNAFLCVKLAEGLNLTAIQFSSCGNEAVAGSYVYSFANGATAITGTDKSITVNNPGTECYITLPAITLSKGYKLTFIRGSETMVKSYGYGTAKTFEAGLIYSTPVVSEFVPINVTLGAVTTSYSLYQQGEIAAANAYSNSTIEVGDCSFTGIPNALIAEAGIIFDGNNTTSTVSSTAKTFAGATLSSTVRSAHAIKAYIKDVDGNTYESSAQDAIITGIPYTAAPPRNSGDYPWRTSGGNIAFETNYVLLRGVVSAPNLISSDFYVPNNIDVNVAVNGNKQGTVVSMSFYVVVNGSNIVSTNLSGGNSPYSLNGNGMFTPTAKSVTVRSDYTTAGPTARIDNVIVNYR